MKTARFILLASVGFASSLRAQLYWDNAGGTANDWGSLANWSTVAGGGTDPAALPTTTDTVVFSASSVAAAQTVNLNAGRSVLGLSFTTSFAHSLLGGGTNQGLTLAAGGIAKTGTGAVTIGSATAGQQVAIALSADQTWANNNATGIITINNGVAASTAVNRLLTLGGTNTLGDMIAGVIANNGAGVMSLAKSDAGLWVLTNTANTYTGGTTVNGGELQAFYNGTTAGTYANLGTGAVTVNAGATLRFRTASTSNAIQWNNAINLNNATLIHDDGTQTLSGAIALTGANTISGRYAGKNLTLSGIISGAGSFTKTNTAAQDTVLILSGVNTYTGSTTVSDGTLRLASAAALGGSTAILVQNNENPAAANTNSLQLSGGLSFGAGKTLTLRNNSTSNIANARVALDNLSGNNTWAGAIVLDQGLNQTLTSTAGTLTVSGNISQSATPSTLLFVRGVSNGVISGGVNLGTAQLFKTESGSWTVSSTGNVHGALTVANGTLVANNNNALDPTATLTLGEGNANQGVFSINATFAQEFAGISTAATTTGAQTISGAGSLSTGAAAKTFTVNDAASVADDLTISATISGAGGFTKAGAGTLFLNGNTVAGPVSVGAGTLRGAFTANGGLSVQAGGTLTPGSSVTAGTITASTLAFGAGASSVAINIGNGPSDQINVVNAGGLTAAGTATFTVSPSGGFTAGNNYNLISYTGASPGTAGFALATLPGRVVGNLTDTGTAIALAVTANDKVQWTGATSAVWDVNTTPNWQTVTGASATNYLQGDDLVFPDGAANTAITLGVAVSPANMEFTNTAATSYAISGAGSLGGAMTLSKTGSGTATLSGSAAHGYTGATTISAGTFVVNQGTGGLTATSGVALSSGATLRLYADNANLTFSRNLTGAGTVVIDPNAGGTAGGATSPQRDQHRGFSGTLMLQPTSPSSVNNFRTVGATAQANLGSAAVIVNTGGQLWWTGAINNNLTISGTGYAEAAGGTPAAGSGLAYGGIGALRMGSDLSGTLTLNGTAKIQNYGGTTILSGAIGVTNPTDLLVVGGGGSGSTTILTGINNAAGAGSLNQIWVNSGGSGGGTDLLQVGNNGTTGTLGLGNVFLQGDAAKTAILRFSRSDGYTLAQDVLASVNTASANLVRTLVHVNTTGAGLTLNGKTIDLSDGTNGGSLYVSPNISGSILNIDTGATVDVGYFTVGEAANCSGAVNQTGGAVSVITNLRVGHWGTETSTYSLSGGTLTFSGTPASTPAAAGEVSGGLYVGIDGTGVFNHSGGTVSTRFVVLDNRGDTPAGTNMPTGVDQYNLSGTGTLELNNAWGVIARNLSTEFNWNGGTIRNMGSSIAVGLNTPITVGASGGTLDTVSAGNSFVLMNSISGSGTLTTAGGGTLTLNPDSNTTRTGTSTGTGTQILSANLAGASPLTKIGAGTTTLSGVNTYTGATTVTAGRLNVSGSANNSAFTVASTLGGEGSIGNLSLSAGSFLAIDPNTTAALSAVALTTTPAITVQFDAQPSGAGLITVLNYTGSRTGATSDFALASTANYRSAVFNDTGTKITLDTGVKALVWNRTSGGQWNLNTSARWNAAEADKFFWGDQVTFDDTGVSAAVTLTGDLRPGSMIVNSSSAGQNYTLTASAGNIIAGSTGLLKAGTSVLTMAGSRAQHLRRRHDDPAGRNPRAERRIARHRDHHPG
ncbi:MAG: autotransporter-associated beta strand repeat-containing protein [Kiritimatiellia bacterium]